MSGKYAAKEAVKKALLSVKIVKNIPLINIEVLNNKDKSPYIKLLNINKAIIKPCFVVFEYEFIA